MVPLLYPPIPPLVDLFGHMGRYRVELDLDHSPWLQRYYDYHWAAIGNLGVDLLIMPLAPLFGLELGGEADRARHPAADRRRLPVGRARSPWPGSADRLFALPFIYGYPFLFGFVNFALSVALAFLAFGLWLRLGRLERTRLRGWLFVPISLIVFFSHTYGWGLLGLMCFSAEAVRLHDRGRPWFRAGFEAALHASVMALPILVMLIWRSETHGGGTDRLVRLEAEVALDLFGAARPLEAGSTSPRWSPPALVFLYALVSRKLTLSRNLAFSAIVLAVSFALLPRIIFGSAYADMRLVPYLCAVVLLAIRFRGAPRPRTAQVLAVLGLAVLRDPDRREHRSAWRSPPTTSRRSCRRSTMMPRGARVITLTGMPCSEYWPLLRNSHLGAMVIVRREGFSNDQWLLEGVNLLDLKYTRGRLFRRRPVAAGAARTVAATAPPDDRRVACGAAARRFRLCLADRRAALRSRSWSRTCSRSGADPGRSSIVCTHDRAVDRRSLLQRGSLPGRRCTSGSSAAARGAVGEDYEIVLVNDGSRDGSWPIMQRPGGRATRTSSRSTCRAITATSSR